MLKFGNKTHEQIHNPKEPNKTNCERCGFVCDTDTDEVCPLCGQTDRTHGFKKLTKEI